MAFQNPNPGRKIRLVLVDDHAIVRQGMANLLGDEPDIEVIGEAAYPDPSYISRLVPSIQ